MAQPNAGVLTDDEVSGAVLDIISGAKEYVVLVSPYIGAWNHLRNEVRLARQRGVRLTFIFRAGLASGDSTRRDAAWLRAEGASLYAVDGLHAKFYLNESSALLTSMNLLPSSTGNSLEVGARMSEEEANALRQYAARLKELGKSPEEDAPTQTDVNGRREKRERAVEEKRAPYVIDKDTPKRVLGKVLGRIHGTHCIRCQALIPHNLDKPLCDKCFAKWNEWKNPDYRERYCHSCGREAATTKAKPRCDDCFAAA